MVPVIIETLVVGVPPSPSVVVLKPIGESPDSGSRVLPIWIGPTEAAAIGIALEGHTLTRPMTHDLLVSTIGALDAKIDSIVISGVSGSTFYASVSLEKDGETIKLDARPSDSIALAVRTQTPLYVEEDVLNSSSYRYVAGEEEEAEHALEEFKDFLESISPEDFTV